MSINSIFESLKTESGSDKFKHFLAENSDKFDNVTKGSKFILNGKSKGFKSDYVLVYVAIILKHQKKTVDAVIFRRVLEDLELSFKDKELIKSLFPSQREAPTSGRPSKNLKKASTETSLPGKSIEKKDNKVNPSEKMEKDEISVVPDNISEHQVKRGHENMNNLSKGIIPDIPKIVEREVSDQIGSILRGRPRTGILQYQDFLKEQNKKVEKKRLEEKEKEKEEEVGDKYILGGVIMSRKDAADRIEEEKLKKEAEDNYIAHIKEFVELPSFENFRTDFLEQFGGGSNDEEGGGLVHLFQDNFSETGVYNRLNIAFKKHYGMDIIQNSDTVDNFIYDLTQAGGFDKEDIDIINENSKTPKYRQDSFDEENDNRILKEMRLERERERFEEENIDTNKEGSMSAKRRTNLEDSQIIEEAKRRSQTSSKFPPGSTSKPIVPTTPESEVFKKFDEVLNNFDPERIAIDATVSTVVNAGVTGITHSSLLGALAGGIAGKGTDIIQSIGKNTSESDPVSVPGGIVITETSGGATNFSSSGTQTQTQTEVAEINPSLSESDAESSFGIGRMFDIDGQSTNGSNYIGTNNINSEQDTTVDEDVKQKTEDISVVTDNIRGSEPNVNNRRQPSYKDPIHIDAIELFFSSPATEPNWNWDLFKGRSTWTLQKMVENKMFLLNQSRSIVEKYSVELLLLEGLVYDESSTPEHVLKENFEVLQLYFSYINNRIGMPCPCGGSSEQESDGTGQLVTMRLKDIEDYRNSINENGYNDTGLFDQMTKKKLNVKVDPIKAANIVLGANIKKKYLDPKILNMIPEEEAKMLKPGVTPLKERKYFKNPQFYDKNFIDSLNSRIGGVKTVMFQSLTDSQDITGYAKEEGALRFKKTRDIKRMLPKF